MVLSHIYLMGTQSRPQLDFTGVSLSDTTVTILLATRMYIFIGKENEYSVSRIHQFYLPTATMNYSTVVVLLSYLILMLVNTVEAYVLLVTLQIRLKNTS